MLILAMDTALDACSAALVETGAGSMRTLAERFQPMRRGHAEALAPMLRDVMTEAAGDWHSLDRIAVTVGPGTFAGVRVGVAMARGLALAARVAALGVTSLEVVAANIAVEDGNRHALPIAAVFDARRGEVYFQLFAADLAPLTEPALLTLAEAASRLPPAGALLVGSAAEMVRRVAGAGMARLALAAASPLPRASVVARRAASKPHPARPPLPLYLRPPDAQVPAPPRVLRIPVP
jgi:tRNA threonylcarbamoyladenosine biosynthesis protein TsaB